MKVTILYQSKNDGRDYYQVFESIEEYLQHSLPFRNIPAEVSITAKYIKIQLTEPIYHTGNFTNIMDCR